MSQRELQRVTVISRCAQGNLMCARAAELLALSLRHFKRLKLRYRQGGASGVGSPRKRRPPAHPQRRLRSAREGQLVQLDGSPHDWLQGRGPLLTALGMQDDASGKILATQFFPSETAEGYFRLLHSLLRRHGVPIALYGDRSGIFTRNDAHWSIDEQLAGLRQPTQFGRALQQLGITFIAAQTPQAKGRIERLWGVLQDRLTSELRLAQAADLDSANAVLQKFVADYTSSWRIRLTEFPETGVFGCANLVVLRHSFHSELVQKVYVQ
ncbi:MAG TPA: helix-turn-helix domain-containing protein [Candidatus Acidoferrales bacterium]|nr:helix-turn-helix domain-containing protein [Candidatus Acidoferrales bacterium]